MTDKLIKTTDELKQEVDRLKEFDRKVDELIAAFPPPYELQVTHRVELLPIIRRCITTSITSLSETIAEESKL